MKIIKYDPKYRDDMLFMYLSAKDALGSVPKLRDDLLDIENCYIASGDMFWLALDDNDRVVGCVGIKSEDDFVWLRRLFIKPNLKHQGIGTALLHVAEEFAREKGVHEIRIHMGDKERYFESWNFYPKHGYELYAPRYMRKKI